MDDDDKTAAPAPTSKETSSHAVNNAKASSIITVLAMMVRGVLVAGGMFGHTRATRMAICLFMAAAFLLVVLATGMSEQQGKSNEKHASLHYQRSRQVQNDEDQQEPPCRINVQVYYQGCTTRALIQAPVVKLRHSRYQFRSEDDYDETCQCRDQCDFVDDNLPDVSKTCTLI